MEITDVHARTIDVPVDVPLREEPSYQTLVFTEVETDEGISGYGLTGGGYWWSGITSLVNQELGPAIQGKNPIETEAVSAILWDGFNPRAQTGIFSEALSTIDIALWDIKGKALGEPVWRLLGGDQNPAECYITFGLHVYTKDELVELATNLVDQGHTRLKMHAYDVEDELDIPKSASRIKAVREAIGDDVHLMIDANYKYSVDQALDLCRRIEECNLSWFEEPVRGNDPAHLNELRNRTQIPIAAGQNEGHRLRHRTLIENGAVDISQPNVVHVGGYTEAKKVAALADSYNLNIANGGAYPHHNAHLHAAVPNGTWIEFHRKLWAAGEQIYEDPYSPDGNQVTLPETPGLGLEPDLNAIEEFETESPARPSRSFRMGSREQITR